MRCAQILTAAAALGATVALSACGGGGGTTASSATQPPTQTQTRTPARTQTGTTTGGAPSSAVLAAGRQAFETNGCSACHTLAAAGATGAVGPDLDRVLPGKSAAFVHQSIVDPNAVIASGYSANVMPQGFGQQISSGDLAALVAYLHAQAGK
jgi:cytochrome c oxidase subunit 2